MKRYDGVVIIEPRIILQKDLKEFNVSESPSNLILDQKTQNEVDEIWIQTERRARELGKNFYNGTSFRLNDIIETDEGITFDFGIFDYKTRFGLARITEYLAEYSEESYRRGCFASAVIRTLDGFYPLIELSSKSMNRHQFEVIGGIMETDIPMRSSDDVYQQMLAEFEEELLVERDTISEIMLKGIYYAKMANCGFHFDIQLNITKDQLQERIDAKMEALNIDVSQIMIFDKETFLDYMNNKMAPSKKVMLQLTDLV